ncbi:MAG TPA: helix-turn-helix transcriptional regulator [Stellaceae bacterium]
MASGPGWQVSDVVCTAGPGDRPFEERHDAMCIAAVTQGTFQYRSTRGAAVLAPGAVMLGNQGDCFECGHEHGVGDRCLSFHVAPDLVDTIAAARPGFRQTPTFAVPRLPPLARLMPLLAEADAARDGGEAAEWEELTLRLTGAVVAALAGCDDRAAAAFQPSPRHERRISEALRRIEAQAAEEPLALADLARDAAMSPYHFLRAFRHVAGMTPHQFILRTRLHRAAVRLRRSDEPVSTIAFDAGFNDLSTFNHRFRRIMGASPSAYRARDWGGLQLGRENALRGYPHPGLPLQGEREKS